MPLLWPLIIGGAGVLGIGATAGYTVSSGAKATADAIKWTILGGAVVATVAGVAYLAFRK